MTRGQTDRNAVGATWPTATLVVPTRNEARNIDEFVGRTCAAMAGRQVHWDIVFADDSDDDTPHRIADLAAHGRPVRCHHRPVGERVNSIAGAILSALTTIDAEIVVVIDADLQHPPEILPAMIGPLGAGVADFVIGSRYLPGGSAVGLDSRWRRFASRAAGTTTRLLLPGLRACTDLSSGLFAFRPAQVPTDQMVDSAFKFLPEALVRSRPSVVAEIPYVFEHRHDGLSKARFRDGITLARQLLVMRSKLGSPASVAVLDDPGRYTVAVESIGCTIDLTAEPDHDTSHTDLDEPDDHQRQLQL